MSELRGRGHATAALKALVDAAQRSPGVRVVQATVAPDNAPSLAVVRRAGYMHVGEQVDGPELVFEGILVALRLDLARVQDEELERRRREGLLPPEVARALRRELHLQELRLKPLQPAQEVEEEEEEEKA